MAKTENSDNTKYWQGCGMFGHSYFTGGNVKWYSHSETEFGSFFWNYMCRVSLVAQRLRIRLPMQGTRVRALVREDPTSRGATKPVRHNYWACALEPASHKYLACVPPLLKPRRLEPMLHNNRSHRDEKPAHHNKDYPSHHN